MTLTFKAGIPSAVPDQVRCCRPTWQRRGRPDGRRFLIPQIQCLARYIAHGIVAPGRQTILTAVFSPRAA